MQVYFALRTWFGDNLGPSDLGLIEYGVTDAWPRPETCPVSIHGVISAVGTALHIDTVAPVRAASVHRKIMNVCHTDRHTNTGSRLYYAALAVTAMVQRCHDNMEGSNASDIRAMPPILITPFEPALARNNPASRFEFHAAGVIADRDRTSNNVYHTRWPRIALTRAIGSIHSSENNLWWRMTAQGVPMDQVFFGTFRNLGPDNFTLDFNGQSHETGPQFVDRGETRTRTVAADPGTEVPARPAT